MRPLNRFGRNRLSVPLFQFREDRDLSIENEDAGNISLLADADTDIRLGSDTEYVSIIVQEGNIPPTISAIDTLIEVNESGIVGIEV